MLNNLNTIANQASKLIKLATRKNISTKTKLLTITSGKGGVGKSTFTANLAFLLSKKGLKVAVLDADIGLANMQVLFDIKPKYTMFDYLEGNCKLKDTIVKTKYENISLIAGKTGHEYASKTNSFVFTKVIDDTLAINYFDIILVDTGAGLNRYVREFLSISDNVLALTTTDPSALTDVYSLMKMLSSQKDKLLLCFNHTKNYQIGETISNSLIKLAQKNRLNKDFMVKYIGNVSTSSNVATTARLRKLFTKEFEEDEITLQMKVITNYIVRHIM